MIDVAILLATGVASLVSLFAAVTKAKAVKKEERRPVSIRVGGQTIEVEARQTDIAAALKKLQQSSPEPRAMSARTAR